jgi:DNA invertase Pin-like site-specific DNA recombinase
MAAGPRAGEVSFVAYYRVSTVRQGESGLGLEAQRTAVAQFVAQSKGALAAEFEEVESGKRSDRPQLAEALAACRARRATLIIAKLDRLARNAKFLLTVVEGTGDNGVVFCDLPQVPPGPMGKFFITLMAAVAELEAGLISQRTKAALAVVRSAIKTHGSWVSRKTGKLCTGLGNPQLRAGNSRTARAGRESQTRRACEHAAVVYPYIEAARKAGATSLRDIADALTARGIQPPSGGDRWHACQVRRIVSRLTPAVASSFDAAHAGDNNK